MIKNDTTPIKVWDVIVAGVLLTRIPLPHAPESAFERQQNAVWAFPVVGLVIGLVGALLAAISIALGLPPAIAALLVLASGMMITGAMHEDGLADTFDGMWGGWDAAQRLQIMKDSHIGTYGVLALILATGTRWAAYSAILVHGPAGVIAAAVLSRVTMPMVMSALPHARDTGLSHAVGRPPRIVAVGALGLGLAIALVCIGATAFLATALACLITACIAAVARRKIGGQTGDILGAVQQLSEISVLLAIVATL